MKITYKKYPILNLLKENIFFFKEFNAFSSIEKNNKIINDFNSFVNVVKHNINIYSESYFDKLLFFMKNHKISKDNLINVLLNKNELYYGIKIYPKYYSLMYMLYKLKENNDNWFVLQYYRLHGNQIFQSAKVLIDYKNSPKDKIKCKSVNYYDHENDLEIGHNVVNIIEDIYFEHFSEIETKFVKPNSKIKASKMENKIINETDIPINIITSKWYTNIINNNPFTVSGHFRNQPYGEGRKDIKLIWIEDFIKSGYNSIAERLKLDNQLN